MLIFAIDPGREKCGVALYDSENGLIFKKVIDSVELVQICKEQLITHNNVKVIMGNGTSSLQHQKNINELLENARLALIDTAEAVKTDLIQSQTMPFDTGTMQNDSTFVDDKKVINKE